ncbi:hypothetical protein [Neorhizobium sp. JUb45]|uniref:hypothetical protein n=1 Tax=unclassified Neorhizobium TaxID=2629175 RepID=UPI0010450E4A|nr:hypothetical protein [Neorhizobium sp. JUb45]TCR04116.1 hypothetical protein EDF70_102214 [Neorhizobium sp. JUb45]
MRRSVKTALSFSLFLALGASQANAQSGFCMEKIHDLKLDPAIMGEGFKVDYMDDGSLQIICPDCQDTRFVAIFLGMNDDREQGLRDGTITAATLTAKCLKTGPNCSAATFVEGPSVGYWLENKFLDKAQRRYALYNGGKVLTVRGTGPLADQEKISANTEAVFRAVLPQMHCGA